MKYSHSQNPATKFIPTIVKKEPDRHHFCTNRDMGREKRGGGLVGGLLKGGGFVVGLGTELHAHNKAKKASSQSLQQQQQQQSPQMRGAQFDGPPTYDETMTPGGSPDSKSTKFDEKSASLGDPRSTSSLPYPVILPQRRPNDKSRGFVRAYAPDLGRCKGIDEDTFLHFLKQFHKSSQASGWFQVINIAAMGAGFAPGVIALAVTTSVQMASRAAAEAHSRYRTNAYLDKANEELFHPKNLHCMVMTFKPEASENALLDFDVDGRPSAGAATALLRFGSGATGMGMGGGRFRKSDGITEGEFALPQAACLVYPAPKPDEASMDVDENGLLLAQKKESSWKSTGKFLNDYRDRRAQAKYAATYGDNSQLAVPGAMDPSKFASRFSDPNGNPFSFMSGEDRQRGTSRDRLQPPERGGSDRSRSSSRGRGSGGLLGGMKDMMKQDVLYLLIAEIPSQEEMRRLL